MKRKFLIQDWDNFTPREQSNLQELIAISLRAKELRSELLDSGDTETKDITPPQDENSLEILSSILRNGFEVTNNSDDKQAEPIGEAIPRVLAFTQLRSSILSETTENCERACNAEFTDTQERKECKRKCRIKRNILAEALLNSSSSIASLSE